MHREARQNRSYAPWLTAILTVLIAMPACASEPLPLASGEYRFRHRFYEHPSIPSIDVTAKIVGRRIAILNPSSGPVFPSGTLAEGTLMWHAASKQWIIGRSDADARAEEVGGCSDGPEVVDLERRIYWTC